MSLADKLDEIRRGAVTRIPQDKRDIMADATRSLRESGILRGVIKEGDKLPPFALENRSAEIVRSNDLLAAGPLVVTLFRGGW